MVRIKRMKYIDIYTDYQGNYIVHNANKPFNNGHTHIKNFNTAKYVAYMALYKKMPKNNHLSNYLIDSVIRISDDTNYIKKMQTFKQEQLSKKGQKEKG